MLLPLVAASGSCHFDSIDCDGLLGGALAAARSSCSCRARYALVLPALVPRLRGSSHDDLVRPSTAQAGVGGRALPGHPRRRARLDRPRRRRPARRAPSLWTGGTDRFTVNQNEFFNRSVGRVYYVGGPTPGGLAETRGRRSTGDGGSARRRRAASPALRARRRLDRARRARVARDPGIGLTLWRVDGPLVATTTQVDGPLPERHVVGPTRHLDAGALPRRHADRRCSASDPHLFTADQVVTASRRTARSSGARRSRRPTPALRVRARPERRRRAASSFDGRAHDAGARAAPTPRELGAHFTPSTTDREDRLRRQPALAPAHGHRQLHPRLARRARRGGRRRARARRLRADEPERPPRDPRGARRARRRACGSAVLPGRTRSGRRWSRLGRPPVERFLGRVDVLHFSDWMYPPQRAGVRATTIHDLVPLSLPGVGDGADALDARPQVRERTRRRATSSSSTRAFTGRRRRRAPRRAGGADPRRAARRLGRVRGRGRARASSAGPYLLSRRHARAAQEPRHARRGLATAARRARARRRRRRRLGRPAAARRPGDPAARLRRRRGAAEADPRRGRLRLPVALRGLRDADRRGDGVRRRRSSRRRTRRWTRRAATRRCASTRTTPRR